MAAPVRLWTHPIFLKCVAAVGVALLATTIAMALRRLPAASTGLSLLDDALYDACYRLRPPADRTGGPVVIIAADDASLANLSRNHKYWPWPRDYWAALIPYLQKCGARAIAFDLLFTEPSPLSQYMDDDAHLASAVDAARIPILMGSIIGKDGKPGPFALPLQKPAKFGAVNILDDRVIRTYQGTVAGGPSLAVAVVQEVGETLPSWASSSFRPLYYGPYKRSDGKFTYRYLSAAYAFADALPAKKGKPKQLTIDPGMFRDKIVLIGATAAALFDLKSTPLSPLYPGVEVQATAIDNLLRRERVHEVGTGGSASLTLLLTILTATGVTLPRRVWPKLANAILGIAALLCAAVVLFRSNHIQWLPLSMPLVAMLLTIVGAFAWTYLVEEKQRRLVLKALSQYVSPAVAAELGRDAGNLKLGGERREMTVMFTDIQGFTTLSESMQPEQLSKMLNFYLGEMASLILATDGTIDKYIGDAIMSFWNAPLRTDDHALRACTAALQITRREREIQEALRELGAPGLLTRVGINTGQMSVGNMGSAQKFNYSVLGDSVNFGSRLEGANKFYDSRILLAESTADLVKHRFLVRRLDLLQVKGKLRPMPVFELMADGRDDTDLLERASLYEQAFECYRAQKWDDAEAILQSLLQKHPSDGPAAALLKRVGKLRHDPPPADWDGAYVAKDK